MSSSKKRLSLPNLHHIGVVVKDLEKTMDYLETKFSCVFQTPPGGTERLRINTHKNAIVRGEKADYTVKTAFTKIGPIHLQLIQHLEGNAIDKDFLETHGEGVHHLGFSVDDLEEEIAKWKELGFEVLQQSEQGAKIPFAYFDTDTVLGVIFEIIQFRSTVK